MIINKTTGEYFNINIEVADTFFKRFKGLMGKGEIASAMLFTGLADSSIHTLFMRFDIDVYFLDDEKRVFDKATLKPWRFYKPSKKAEFILESEKNRLKIEIGDKLDFI